jgi:lipopolysaccharide export system permease protein
VNTLDRYIVRSIIGSVLLVTSVFLVLGGLFVFIDQQDDIGVGHYNAMGALWFTLLNLPQQAYELLPVTALLGSLLGLGSLARGSELVVIRATGVSVQRIAGAVAIAGLLLIGGELLLGEVLAPPLQEAAKEQKAFSKFNNISFGGGGGAWVRDGNLIINVARQSGQRQFDGMQIFELSPDHRLRAIGHAAGAIAGAEHQWLLSDYTESRFNEDKVSAPPLGQRVLKSNVSYGFLGLAIENPKQLTSRSLVQLISYLQANSLSTRDYVFALSSRIARTVAILFSVLLGLPFVLGSLRSAGAGTRMLMGLIVGVGLFLLQKLIESGTVVFDLNPVLLAWLPTTMLATVTLLLLARAR